MRRIAKFFPLLVLFVLVATPLAVHAAGKKAKGEVVMKVGNKVNLFYSGGTAAQKEIAVGDLLPVFRMTPKHPELKPVGEVKVLGFIGEHYFQAEITKGDVKVGDIAKKEKTGLLVQPSW
jgi:hypothetical protein